MNPKIIFKKCEIFGYKYKVVTSQIVRIFKNAAQNYIYNLKEFLKTS